MEAAYAPDFSVAINAKAKPAGSYAGRFNAPAFMKLLLSFKKNSNKSNGTLFASTETSPSKRSVKRIGPMMRFVVSYMQFYSYRIMFRDNSFNHLYRTRDLFL